VSDLGGARAVHLDRLAAQAPQPAETEKLLRIMKLTEETGEVMQAIIGAMGQNPRKGVTHTRDEMLPLASRNPNDGRGGQGPFEMADLQRHSLEDDKEDRREYRYQADDPEGHRIRRLTRFNAADTVLLLRLEVPRVMTAQYQRAHRKR
jgi:hypothetical protein